MCCEVARSQMTEHASLRTMCTVGYMYDAMVACLLAAVRDLSCCVVGCEGSGGAYSGGTVCDA